MDVAPIGNEECLASSGAPDDGPGRVDQRYAQREDRYPWGHRPHAVLGERDADRGNDEAQEHRAGVTHDDRRRVEVVGEEADGGADGGRDDRQGRVDAVDRRQQAEGAKYGERHARGKAVEAVDQVDRVDDTDDPGDGDRQGERPEVDDGPGQEDAVDAQAEPPGDDRGTDLEPELHHRAHAAHVVDDSDHEEHGDTGQDRRSAVGPQSLRLPQVRRSERGEPDGDPEGDGHRHAAEPRNRDLVDLAAAGLVQQPVTVGSGPHQRSDDQPDDEGDGESEGGQHRVPRMVAWSGRPDSNRRPPAPKAGDLPD